jgi:hypothetical protein
MLTGLLNGLVFLLVNGFLIYSCWLLSNYLLKDHQSLSLRLVAAIILSFAHATVVVLLLGVVFRYLNAWSVPILSLLISISIFVRCKNNYRPFLRPAKQALSETFSTRDYFLYAIAFLLVLQLAILIIKVILLPPHIWDAFVYHLPPAVEWYQQGFIPPVLETSVNRINASPLGMTVLAYWFFIFFRDDFLLEMPMFLWALSLIPVSIAVMRQSGVSRAWSFKFAAVIFFLPIVLMQAITNKDQLGLNVALIAGLLFLAEFIKHKQYVMIIMAATALGLMVGYKMAAPIYVLVALLMFSAILWARHRSLFVGNQALIKMAKTFSLSVIIALLVGGYWYLRNLLLYGRLTGIYRSRLDEAGERVANKTGVIEAAFGKADYSEFIQTLLSDFLPRTFDYQNFYGADLVLISGFGPQFAAFGLLAMLVAILAFFSSRLRQQPIFLLSSVVILLFPALMLFNYDANTYRVLSFFPMVLIAYAGVQLYNHQWLRKSWVSTMTSVMIVVCIAWSGLTLLPPHYTNMLRFKAYLSLDHDSRTSANYTSWYIRPRPSFYRIMDAIPVNEPIAHIASRPVDTPGSEGLDTWKYLYMDRHWKRKTFSLHLPLYFNCLDNGDCTPKPALKTFLKKNKVSLLSSCKTNRCLTIRDDALIEVLPGLYYFLGNG